MHPQAKSKTHPILFSSMKNRDWKTLKNVFMETIQYSIFC